MEQKSVISFKLLYVSKYLSHLKTAIIRDCPDFSLLLLLLRLLGCVCLYSCLCGILKLLSKAKCEQILHVKLPVITL